jgi:Carboxypeptidase regulatory-like domain
MAGDDRVRYCGQCRLNVYNLSAMSAKEAENLVASREGRLCVRFYQRRDGTVLTKDCPVGLRIVMRRLARVAGIAFSALVNVLPVVGCARSLQGQVVRAESGLDLVVVDQSGAVCYGAKVEILRDGQRVGNLLTTDNEGELHVGHLSPGTYTLKVMHRGFEPYETRITLSAGARSDVKATLEVLTALQGAVMTLVTEGKIPVIQSETPLLTPVHVPDPKPGEDGFFRRWLVRKGRSRG